MTTSVSKDDIEEMMILVTALRAELVIPRDHTDPGAIVDNWRLLAHILKKLHDQILQNEELHIMKEKHNA